MNKLARLGKLLGVLPGTSQDAVMDKASDRIEDLQSANSTAHVAVAELAKALDVVRPYNTAEVLQLASDSLAAKKLAREKDRRWTGAGIAVGDLVQGGKVVALADNDGMYCVMTDGGLLEIWDRTAFYPIQDDADKVADVWLDAAKMGDDLDVASALRFLEDQGLISFRSPDLPPVPPGCMTVKAEGKSYEDFIRVGWLDAQLREEGYMV